MKNINNGYLAISYHYIPTSEDKNLLPRILGNNINEFRKHIKMLKQEYNIISLDDAYKFSYSDFEFDGTKPNILLTFDDALSDHYEAAKILAENDIKGVFFVPTCILEEKLPINPFIVHYCLAAFGIDGFLGAYRRAFKDLGINLKEYDIKFNKKTDNQWEVIFKIKNTLRYKLGYKEERDILLYIYRNLFLKKYPNALEIIHLTSGKIKEIINMGHSIGTHSFSHISVAATELTKEDFEKEMIDPKKYLETEFNIPVISLSYPLGKQKDCLSMSALIKKTNEYKIAFSIENIVNTKETSPLELGRHVPTSRDDYNKLKETLHSMQEKIIKI